MNTRLQTSLWALLVAVTAPTAAALNNNPVFSHEVNSRWDVPTYGSPGTITRLVCGDVTGDLRPDVFARGGASGKEILFMYAPFQGTAMTKLTETANDFDIAVGDGLNGVDVLVTVGPEGLRRMFYTGSTPPFVADSPVLGNWVNARIVRCGNVNATAGVDYIGLKDDTTTVIYRRENGTETTFSADSPVLDIQLLHWAPGTALQVALLTNAGIEIRNPETGLTSNTFPNSGAIGDAIAVVHVGTTGPDRLMWATHVSGQNAVLKQLRRQGPQTEATLALARDDVVSMASGPSDGTQGEDLVVCFKHVYTPLQLTNQSLLTAGPVFDLSAAHSQTVTVPQLQPPGPYDNVSTPIYRDLDNDGKGDLLLAVSGAAGSAFEVLHERLPTDPPIDFDGGQFFLGSLSTSEGTLFRPQLDTSQSAYEYSFAFQFETLDVNNTNYIEIVVWDQHEGSAYIEKTALRRFLVPCTPAAPAPIMLAEDILIDPPVPANECLGAIRWLEVRQVHWDGTKITLAGPTYAALVARGDIAEAFPQDANYPHFTVYNENSGQACVAFVDDHWPLTELTRRRRTDPPPGQTPVVPAASFLSAISVPQ